MVISRTPFRISFFGGGTDYHTWFEHHGGAVLSTTINHYCYLHCRTLPAFFNHKSRVVWSKVEEVYEHSQIQHPAVKAVLKHLHMNEGVEIHHQGDLPARSGLGSSSAFTVGLLNALNALRGNISSKRDLASEAIYVERHVIKENVGIQDQIETAFGGLNKITISPNGHFDVNPIILAPERLQSLHDHLVLFFTGISRTASDIAADKIQSIPKKQIQLRRMHEMVDESIQILCNELDLIHFGELLHESWMLKRSISQSISPGFIDDIYERAMHSGAIGGKLLGAGGGGFMLFFVTPDKRAQLCEALKDLLLVPFQFESNGSQIIFYENSPYSPISISRRDYSHLMRTINDFEMV